MGEGERDYREVKIGLREGGGTDGDRREEYEWRVRRKKLEKGDEISFLIDKFEKFYNFKPEKEKIKSRINVES